MFYVFFVFFKKRKEKKKRKKCQFVIHVLLIFENQNSFKNMNQTCHILVFSRRCSYYLNLVFFVFFEKRIKRTLYFGVFKMVLVL